MRGRFLTNSVLLAAAALLVLPQAADAKPKCGGKPAKFVGTKGRDVFKLKKRGRQAVVGRGGNDLIITRLGRDRICGGKGNDTIVSGRQPDLVRGGKGDDTIYGGSGADHLFGGSGADNVFGDAGSDQARGGSGPDRVFGGLVDDAVRGNHGDDVVVGGHGGDGVIGGPGEDWLRGGTNRDGYHGGKGVDTISFATATPTSSPRGRSGVSIDLGAGRATGEGRRERFRGIENALGSPFSDLITGGRGSNFIEGGYGDDVLRGAGGADRSNGGPGSDACAGFEAADPGCNDSDPRPAAAVAAVEQHGRDPGLIVFGQASDGRDVVHVEATTRQLLIYAEGPLVAGTGCFKPGVLVRCNIDPGRIGWTSIAGLDGDDALSADGGLPRRGEVQLDGGPDSDKLKGTRGDDILLAGPDGRDRLAGGRGNDALISESGRDALLGGSGNDQLVTDDPCDGHLFDGGRGSGDIAGFARAPRARVRARIGGKAIDLRKGRCRGTRIRRDNEVLEGTRNGDVLIGSPGDDPFIIGGPGDDRLEGRGGDDVLDGEEGRDIYVGGRGSDLLKAKDGRRDRRLDCGPGSDFVKRDGIDPPPRRCRPPKEQLLERRTSRRSKRKR